MIDRRRIGRRRAQIVTGDPALAPREAVAHSARRDAINSPGDAPSSLWRREGDGAWAPVVLAPDLQPRLVHARGPDDVWLSAKTRDHAVVLHSREPSRVLALDPTLALIHREFGPR